MKSGVSHKKNFIYLNNKFGFRYVHVTLIYLKQI